MKYTFLLSVLMIMLFLTVAVSCSDDLTTTTAIETTKAPFTSQSEETTSCSVTTTPSTTKAPTTTDIPTVYTISPIEAKEMMEEGGVTIVDVRRVDEYQEGHIPNAILAPNETILTDAANLLPDKNAILLVYCRSGRRSAEAAQKLVSLGYRHVYDFGGIIDWPYDVIQ